MLKSVNQHRLKQNPLEEKFLSRWIEQSSSGQWLEYILSGPSNKPEHVEERDKLLVNTVIQWLGSPVGQSFLKDVMTND